MASSLLKFKERSPHYVDLYFSHSIELFKDDLYLMKDVKNLIENLPNHIRAGLCLIYNDKLLDLP